MRFAATAVLLLLLWAALPRACGAHCGDGICDEVERTSGLCSLDCGGPRIVYAQIACDEVGLVAVRIDAPAAPRYGTSAPIVVVASTWFVEKYELDETPFHLVYNPVDIGAISISHLWPGKTDPETGIRSDGIYDYGGPSCLAALRDAIRFALGEIPDVRGAYLRDLIDIEPLYDNVGLFASSHAGVVATNVIATRGETFPRLKYFVGRENPTMAEMYPLEIGHFDDLRRPVYNPYYDPAGYGPTNIAVDYSTVGWLQNADYPRAARSSAFPAVRTTCSTTRDPS